MRAVVYIIGTCFLAEHYHVTLDNSSGVVMAMLFLVFLALDAWEIYQKGRSK